MTVWDYGIKYPYGYSEAYGTEFHTGEDWTVVDHRVDIPVTVNGVVIGIAGTTGNSTGIHTHVGKWSGGQHYPPEGRGRSFNSAVVTEIHPNDTDANGKFVRVQGDGYSYVYLHLDSIGNIKVGQVLEGEDMATDAELAQLKQQNIDLQAQIDIMRPDLVNANKTIDGLNLELTNERAAYEQQIADLQANGGEATVLASGTYQVK